MSLIRAPSRTTRQLSPSTSQVQEALPILSPTSVAPADAPFASISRERHCSRPSSFPLFQPGIHSFFPKWSQRPHVFPGRKPIPLRGILPGKDLCPVFRENGLAHTVAHSHRTGFRIDAETVLAVSFGLRLFLYYECPDSHYLMSPSPLLEPKSIRETNCTPSASKIQPREPSLSGSSFLAAAAA